MRLIGLCGSPKSGKSEVARILREKYGAVIVDDGMILRTAAPFLFHGVEIGDTLTQEGKNKSVVVNGKPFTVRKLLGDLGQILEDYYGEDYIPDQTMQRIANLAPAPFYVMPSVRKTQGHLYRRHYAAIWEIDRDVPASPHAFDKWDKTVVTQKVDNNRGIPDLERNVHQAVHQEFFWDDPLVGETFGPL